VNEPGDTAPSDPDAEAFCAACNSSYAPTTQFCPLDGARLVRFAGGADPLLGRVIDARFEIQQRIGRGGMGAVYRAWQRSVDREVAIKVIDARLSNDRVAAKRFLREARLASRLSHPAIVVVHDFGQTDDGVLYLAMEMLRGKTLAAAIATRAMTPRRAIKIALQLCDALEAAHRQDIVHRDLKPQNVVVLDDPPGRDLCKVLDFGLAKSLVHDESAVTRSDAILGTPLYMAPEAIQGHAADGRTDLYSLGCILHELLSGLPPFRDNAPNMVLAMHLSEPPPELPSTVPATLAALVRELLAKAPADRPATATAVRDRLAEMLDASIALDQAAAPSTGSVVAPAAFADTMASPRGTQAHTRDATTREAATRVAFEPSQPAPSRSRAPLYLAAAILAAGAGVVGFLALREPPAAAPPPDAAPVRAVPPDAARAAPDASVPLDAGVPIDAARPPIDAGRARTKIDAGRATPPIDAARPPIDAARPPIDARPDVPFILPGAGSGS